MHPMLNASSEIILTLHKMNVVHMKRKHTIISSS